MVKEALYPELIHPRRQLGPHDVLPCTITNRRSPGNMRKYYQAALIVIALVSVVSLLFYRHEYNRLRYVLEVINFFGKPGVKEADLSLTPEKLALRFDSPLPSWQRLNDELFVYSAHLTGGNEIRAVAFGKVHGTLNMNCNVFFNDKPPVLGSFKYFKVGDSSHKSIIGKNVEYTGYLLRCSYLGHAIPEGVSFFGIEDNSGSAAPVLNVKQSPQSRRTNEVALCVAPPLNRSLSHRDMISFLSFHQVIGVAHFVVYDYEVPSSFSDSIRDIIESQNLNFTFSIVPWNFPFIGVSQDIMKELVEKDCLYRSYNKVGYSITLYWEEYVVLKYHHTLPELLSDLDKSTPSSECYTLNTSVFCTQQEDDKKATYAAPILIKKTLRISSGNVRSPYIYISKPHKSLDPSNMVAKKVSTDLINVNHYQYCSDTRNEFSYSYDHSILRFAENMLDTTIYKQYIARHRFSRK